MNSPLAVAAVDDQIGDRGIVAQSCGERSTKSAAPPDDRRGVGAQHLAGLELHPHPVVAPVTRQGRLDVVDRARGQAESVGPFPD